MPWLRAATDNPSGFHPHGPVLRVTPYSKDASAVAIYPGDVVILETDGGIGVSVTNSTNIVGVAAEYSAASTAKTDFLVYDHPEQLFWAQDDGDTTQMAETEVGNNTPIVTTTGSTTTLQSLHEIDSSGAGTTASLPIKIHGLHPIEARSFATTTGQQRKWVVSLNNHLHSAYQQVGV